MHTPDPLQASQRHASAEEAASAPNGKIVLTLPDFQRLLQAAQHGWFDLLTGLLTRYGFSELFGSLERQFRSGQEPCFGLLELDLVGLKKVNDRRGQAQGDDVIADFGGQLRAAVRGDDLVARIGGDEFLVLLRGVADEDRLRRVIQRLQRPYSLKCGRRRVRLETHAVGRVATLENVEKLPRILGDLLPQAKRARIQQRQTAVT